MRDDDFHITKNNIDVVNNIKLRKTLAAKYVYIKKKI